MVVLQEQREAPTHPEIPDERKFAELGQCKDNSAALLCQLAVTGPSVGQGWSRAGHRQSVLVQGGNCLGMSRDMFDPYPGPTVFA